MRSSNNVCNAGKMKINQLIPDLLNQKLVNVASCDEIHKYVIIIAKSIYVAPLKQNISRQKLTDLVKRLKKQKHTIV